MLHTNARNQQVALNIGSSYIYTTPSHPRSGVGLDSYKIGAASFNWACKSGVFELDTAATTHAQEHGRGGVKLATF